MIGSEHAAWVLSSSPWIIFSISNQLGVFGDVGWIILDLSYFYFIYNTDWEFGMADDYGMGTDMNMMSWSCMNCRKTTVDLAGLCIVVHSLDDCQHLIGYSQLFLNAQ